MGAAGRQSRGFFRGIIMSNQGRTRQKRNESTPCNVDPVPRAGVINIVARIARLVREAGPWAMGLEGSSDLA
jgi:hypothetical protein